MGDIIKKCEKAACTEKYFQVNVLFVTFELRFT